MKLGILISFLCLAPQHSLQLRPAKYEAALGSIPSPSSLSQPLGLVERAQKQGDSCGKCSKRKCIGGRVRDPNSCKCVKPGNNNDDDRKKKKQEKLKETIERKKKEYPKKRVAKKKKELLDKKKETKKSQYKTDKKRTRMGKCLLLVPMAMYGAFEGTTAVASYAEDYFSEDFVTSEAIDEFWPGDLGDPVDVDIDSDEYTTAYVEIAAKVEDSKDTSWKPREPISVKFRRAPGPDATTAGLAVVHQHEKRNPIVTVLARILSFAGRFANATRNVVGRFATISQRVNARLKNLAERGGARLAKGGGKAKPQDMKNAARTVSKNKNWKNCLKGAKPS